MLTFFSIIYGMFTQTEVKTDPFKLSFVKHTSYDIDKKLFNFNVKVWSC